MQWWTWMILGILLLATELFAIDAQFYLVFLGAGALVVSAGLTGLDVMRRIASDAAEKKCPRLSHC